MATLAVEPLDDYRQSLLTGYVTCPRRTLHSINVDDFSWSIGNVGTAGLLGTAFHSIAAEILRTLWRTGQAQMDSDSALNVMRETLAREEFALSIEDQIELKWLVIGFSHFDWPSNRILSGGLEKRLYAYVHGPDGVARRVSGQPDLILSDPPAGLVIVDWKSGHGRPPAPRGHSEDEFVEGKQYLSPGGTSQLYTYGFLAMNTYPSLEYVKMREYHLRHKMQREATVTRAELEDISAQLGDIAMKLDLALHEGVDSKRWKPLPGAHCARRCPVAKSCPIPAEQRGNGAIHTNEQADQYAQGFLVAKSQTKQYGDALKTYWDETGYEPVVGDQVLGWHEKPNGSRSFSLHDPVPDTVE